MCFRCTSVAQQFAEAVSPHVVDAEIERLIRAEFQRRAAAEREKIAAAAAERLGMMPLPRIGYPAQPATTVPLAAVSEFLRLSFASDEATMRRWMQIVNRFPNPHPDMPAALYTSADPTLQARPLEWLPLVRGDCGYSITDAQCQLIRESSRRSSVDHNGPQSAFGVINVTRDSIIALLSMLRQYTSAHLCYGIYERIVAHDGSLTAADCDIVWQCYLFGAVIYPLTDAMKPPVLNGDMDVEDIVDEVKLPRPNINRSTNTRDRR